MEAAGAGTLVLMVESLVAACVAVVAYTGVCVVSLVCAKSVSEWTIGASGIVWVMACRMVGSAVVAAAGANSGSSRTAAIVRP